MTELRLSERWWGVGGGSAEVEAKREAVLHELEMEIGSEHELSGLIVRVEAFFEASDDVIVRLVDGTYALVHPTWSAKTERPSHPTTRRLGLAAEAAAEVAQWELSW